MVDLERVHEILLSFEGINESLQNKIPRYKFKSKTFATFNIEKQWLTILLTPEQQGIYTENPAIYAVPNKWGIFGWTHVNLLLISEKKLLEVLIVAYSNSKK